MAYLRDQDIRINIDTLGTDKNTHRNGYQPIDVKLPYLIRFSLTSYEIKTQIRVPEENVRIANRPFLKPGEKFEFYIPKCYLKKLSEGIDFSEEKILNFGFIESENGHMNMVMVNELMVADFNNQYSTIASFMYVFPFFTDNEYDNT